MPGIYMTHSEQFQRAGGVHFDGNTRQATDVFAAAGAEAGTERNSVIEMNL